MNQVTNVAGRLFGVEELAHVLGVSAKTIYYWVERREIPFLKIGRHLRFQLEDVIHFFQQKTAENATHCLAGSPLIEQSNITKGRASWRSLAIRDRGLAYNEKE